MHTHTNKGKCDDMFYVIIFQPEMIRKELFCFLVDIAFHTSFLYQIFLAKIIKKSCTQRAAL